jgi:hypothetical protein
MLKNTKELYGIRLAASDGDIGHVKDFSFDEARLGGTKAASWHPDATGLRGILVRNPIG